MTLEQIRYFVTSADSGSFSGAAKQMFVSHSSVCRGVSALEKELGVKLFVRGGRELHCTRAGEIFLRQSRALIRQTVQMRDSVARYRERQQLVIVSIGAYMPRFYDLIGSYGTKYPEVDLMMEQVDHLEVVKKLYSGEADIGISFSYSWPEDPALETLPVETGNFCVLVPPKHPFAKKAALTRGELLDCPDLLGENPFRPTGHPDADSYDIQSIILQIKSGKGITVLPEHAALAFGQGCIQLPICGGIDEYQLLLCWRKENSSDALRRAIALFRSGTSG